MARDDTSGAPQQAQAAQNPYRTTFLPLWAGMVAFQSGLLIQDVAAAYAISNIAEARGLVALVPTASSLPFFLFALPAGALADIVDRRRMAAMAAAGLMLLALVSALCAASGAMSVPLLLGASFLCGVGNALFTPCWQALTPAIVPQPRLAQALALNSLGINIARSIGPVAAGFALSGFGLTAAFLLNVAVYAGVTGIFIALTAGAPPKRGGESYLEALGGGVAFALYDAGLKRVAARAVCYFLFASTFWALLPLKVRDSFGGGGLMLGLLVGAIGIGAVLGAVLLPHLRKRFDLDRLMVGAGLAAAVLLAVLAVTPSAWLAAPVLGGLGITWIVSFSSIHLAAQLRLPNWIRARGTAVYLLAIYGALAGGSALSGFVAGHFSLAIAFLVAASGLVVTTLLARRALPIVIAGGQVADARSLLLSAAEAGRAVEIVYRPAAGRTAELLDGARSLRHARLRAGATDHAVALEGDVVVERISFRTEAAMARAAVRHRPEDAALEARLVALSEQPPQSRSGAADERSAAS